MQNIKLISLDNKMTAAQWLAQQTVKPKNIINGSLWSATRPVGTIYQDGKVIWDSGNADGFGVDRDGVPRFGRAYGDIKWRDFLSGYPGLIKEGKALAIPSGNSVYTSQATRSVVYMQGGLVRFACFPAQTMAALQTKLLQLGVTEAIALDGGGSCFLYANGVQTEYQSKDNKGNVRKLMNILVEYDTETSSETTPRNYAVTAKSGLNMRNAPTTSGQKVCLLPEGFVVQVSEIRDGWAKLDGLWCSAEYLKEV